MTLALTQPNTRPVYPLDIVEAIAISCSPAFGALNMCNALGGAQTDVWRLVREFPLERLIDEAAELGLDLGSVKAACCDVLVGDTPPFRAAVGYDPRPRCGLCGRVHYIDKRSGDRLSCGDTARFRNWPELRWTRATAEQAMDGTYVPQSR